jgi:hypothetical protein
MELKIEYLPIKALKPYEKNTRKHQKKDVGWNVQGRKGNATGKA